MSTTTPPISISNGVTAQLVQPGGGQYGNVVVANTSQFQLTVSLGADTFYLQPFTEMLYPLQPSQQAPVNLSPSIPAGATFVAGQPNQVSATWYLYGEKPTGQWPFSFVGQAIQTGINGAINVQQAFQTTTITNQLTAPGGAPEFDVSAYASLLMKLGNTVAGQKVVLTIIWFADAACTIPTGIADNFAVGEHPTVIMIDAWEIPVRGAGVQLFVRTQSTGNASIFLEGTNRLVPSIKQILTTQLPREFTVPAQNLATGTFYPFGNADGLGDYTTLNGPISVSLTISDPGAVTVTGQLVATWCQYNATAGNFVYAAQTATGSGSLVLPMFNHPNIPIRWQWFSQTTSANITLTLTLVPTGPQ